MLSEFLKAIFLGIVEGITEWLPVSSTGHMILVDSFLRLDLSEAFASMFFVVIQLGAIAAVVLLYFDRLFPFSKIKNEAERKTVFSLWGKVIAGSLPAALAGLLLDDLFDRVLMKTSVVAAALFAYGVAFIFVEKTRKNASLRAEKAEDITFRDAFLIGCFQMLSLVPGTSRSGATILGGMLVGVSRTAATEFSFFMAIPIMLGASGLKMLKFFLGGFCATPAEWMLLLVGALTAFAVSLVAIRFLTDFVRRHSFAPFGIYRIALSLLLLIFFIVC